MLCLQSYYGKKLQLLFCPAATLRRGPGPREIRVPEGSPAAVEYGGPTTTVEFPISDPSAPPGAPNRPLTASYGENCWVYNPPPSVPDIQGRATIKNWRKISACSSNTNPLNLPFITRI